MIPQIIKFITIINHLSFTVTNFTYKANEFISELKIQFSPMKVFLLANFTISQNASITDKKFHKKDPRIFLSIQLSFIFLCTNFMVNEN